MRLGKKQNLIKPGSNKKKRKGNQKEQKKRKTEKKRDNMSKDREIEKDERRRGKRRRRRRRGKSRDLRNEEAVKAIWDENGKPGHGTTLFFLIALRSCYSWFPFSRFQLCSPYSFFKKIPGNSTKLSDVKIIR